MASIKIHLFRQSAVEAGTPGDYYINPSEKLMSVASEWRAVEHEDAIELIFDENASMGFPIFIRFSDTQAIGDSENKEDVYSYIVNTDFLDVNKMDGEFRDGVTKIYIPKIKAEGNDKNVVEVQAEL
ncbi:hypothetical protein MKW98_016960 [Papaver atlanticum]|uniref:Uncharacterized protein n=1 Tax=Papaver atlanticum TaxID=357466 RepID=A0AAD4TKG8_9MAGN|nr:hypothetical protein MKW98_016960 [Papaver atlanticum]